MVYASQASEVNFTTIPVEYAEVLVDFLYDNSASRLLSKKYTEAFVTNMILIADQLFVDRLKDVFQVHVLKRFTMRRSADWLELAFTYHCDLLKKSIFDFLCANLSEVLESRLLEHVDMEYLTELDVRYRDMFPEIKYRQVVPSCAIDEEYIVSVAKHVQVDLSVGRNGTASNGTPRGVSKEVKVTTKTKTDYEKEGKLSLLLKEGEAAKVDESPAKADKNLAAILSEDSVRLLSQIQEKNRAIWTKVNTDKKPEPRRKVVGLVNANEVLRNEEKMCDNFSNLKLALNAGDRNMKKDDSNDNNADDDTPSAAAQELSPSPFNSPLSFGDFLSPPSGGMGRLSQKQRKRQSSRPSESEGGGDPATPYRPAPESVWNIPTIDSALATQLDFGEMSASRKKTPNSSQKTSSSNKKRTPEARTINFDSILVEERREKEYFAKLKNKPLTLTQLEESAISELLTFYNAERVFDEAIVIARKVRQQVSQNFSQWARPTTENSSLDCGAAAVSLDETV